jgi:hypothetical protein
MARLEDLTKGALVRGVLGDRVVKVVDIAWHGSSAVRYIHGAFRDIGDLPFDAISVNLHWRSYSDRGEVPA